MSGPSCGLGSFKAKSLKSNYRVLLALIKHLLGALLMVPGPRFELGTTNKNNEKTLFMPCDKGQMSKYSAFKKTSIPLPYQ